MEQEQEAEEEPEEQIIAQAPALPSDEPFKFTPIAFSSMSYEEFLKNTPVNEQSSQAAKKALVVSPIDCLCILAVNEHAMNESAQKNGHGQGKDPLSIDVTYKDDTEREQKE